MGEGGKSLEDIQAFTSQRDPIQPFDSLLHDQVGLAQFLRRMLEKDMKTRYSAPAALLDTWFSTTAGQVGTRTRNVGATTGWLGQMMPPFNSSALPFSELHYPSRPTSPSTTRSTSVPPQRGLQEWRGLGQTAQPFNPLFI